MNENIQTKKKYYILFSFYFLFFGVVVAILTSLINYNIRYTDIKKRIESKAFQEVEYKIKFAEQYVSRVESIVLSVLRNEITKSFIKEPTEAHRSDMNSLFYSLVFSNQDLMQLRYIDADGLEVVRVDKNRITQRTKIVGKDKLQNKASRYYFKEASLVSKNSFWHSNVDLNMEHGKIEKPIKPTFRVASPVYEGVKFKGIVVANLLMDSFVDNMRRSTNFDVTLYDREGEVIVESSSENSWSRYLPDRKSIYDLYPSRFEDYKSAGNFIGDNLFVFDINSMFRNKEKLRIAFHPKDIVVSEMKRKNSLTAGLIALTVLLVSIPLSWVASFVPSKLQSSLADAYNEVKEQKDIIDRYVIISRTDKEGRIKSASSAFLDISGYKEEEVLGKTHSIIKHPDTDIETHKNLWKTITDHRVWKGDLKNRKKNGESFWVEKYITPETDKSGEITGYTAIAQNITDKKIIESMSVTDRLTGIYNRHKLDEVLEHEMNRYNRYREAFCVLLIDVDHFKQVNDVYGHQAGDIVLQLLSKVLKENTRGSDFVGRWGGEEFLIIAPKTTVEEVSVLAEKLRSQVESKDFPDVGAITASFGVAEYVYGETIANFINRADDALYSAKRGGRNRVEIASEC